MVFTLCDVNMIMNGPQFDAYEIIFSNLVHH